MPGTGSRKGFGILNGETEHREPAIGLKTAAPLPFPIGALARYESLVGPSCPPKLNGQMETNGTFIDECFFSPARDEIE